MSRGGEAASNHAAESKLRRALGRWDLTAIGINQVIGGAIFLVPAQVYLHLGAWSPYGVVLAGLCTMLVALCFAESGSRFDATGGAYLYTRVAFGPLMGMEVAWMQWFTRVTSLASVANGITIALGFYFKWVSTPLWRNLLITAIALSLMLINMSGIRQSVGFLKVLTLAKLLPLVALVSVGVWFIRPQSYGPLGQVSLGDLTSASLLLVFAFGGFDVVGIPAGESKAPRRDISFALVTTVAGVTLIFTLLQVVLMGTMADLAHTQTPVADAMQHLLGAPGAMLVAVGAVLSMLGNNMGQILAGSRILFALARRGELLPSLAHVSPERGTPIPAIVATTMIALALALTGSFARLAAVSAVARLTTYAGVAAATLQLRRMDRDRTVPRATFIVPGGPAVPVLALLSSLVIMAGATWEQLAYGSAALLAGVILFLLSKKKHSIPQ